MWDSAGSVESTCSLGAGIVHCSGVSNPCNINQGLMCPLAENGVGSPHTTSGVSSSHKFNGAINYQALGWCLHMQKCMC